MDLHTAVKERKSVRAYLEREVARRDIEEVLRSAARAPSAINLQPWEFVVTYGDEKERLVRRLLKARSERAVSCGPETDMPLPGRFSRRSAAALAVMEPSIGRMGCGFNEFIEEGSCSFYGAPVAIIVMIHRIFPVIRFIDVGIAVSHLLLSAHAKGLAACPIGLIRAYSDDIADILAIPEDREILLGIALGYADGGSPANAFQTPRVGLNEVVTWYE